MPIYEYICDDCGSRYERIVLSKSQEIACPKCESKKNTLQLSVFRASNGGSSKSTPSFSGGGGGCCGGGGCGCH